MGIDPTFDLGEFSVTPIVYQNLLIVNDRGLSPWVLGPILVHYRKEFRNYNFFLSSLLGLRHSLASVQAVGTDGEKNLIEAIHQQFQNAIQLRCFRHLQSNLERHLHEKKVPMSIIQLYTQDVFGRDSQDGVHFEGLVDCSSEEDFLSQLRRLKPIWDKRDLQFSAEAHFYEWFRKFKMEDFIKGTLREIREKAGLGCPPKAYYTNSNEAINRILKEAVQWKKSPLPEFINKMKAVVDQQKSEMEKAIISTGEYSLKPQFDGLKIEQSLFYRMNEKQRLHCLKRFHTSTLDEASHIQDIGTTSSSKGKGKAKANSLGSLIPIFEQVATLLLLPSESLKGIWTKAFDLCNNNPKAIVPMPGGGDKDCFVLSKSSMLPHAVTIKGLLYQCDA
jgi:hypothetical protein